MVQRLGFRLFDEIPQPSEPLLNIEQMKIPRVAVVFHLFPSEGGGDGGMGASPWGIGGGQGFAVPMLQIVDVDEVAAVLF